MLVNNTEAKNYSIGYTEKNDDKNHKSGRPLPVRFHILKPGVNKVDDNRWKSMKNHKKIKYLLEEGHLEEMDGSLEKPEEGSTADLSLMKAGDAVKVVRETLDVELLEDWSDQESRVSVQKAIRVQLKKMELTPEEKKALEG